MNATGVTAGPAESNGSLLQGIWRDSLHVTCGLTACTPGSAPGPTLGNKYGKTLPFYRHSNTSSCIAGQDERSAVAIFLTCMSVHVCRPKSLSKSCSGLVRYDFNRLAVYLSFRTPIGGSFPLPLPSGGATEVLFQASPASFFSTAPLVGGWSGDAA